MYDSKINDFTVRRLGAKFGFLPSCASLCPHGRLTSRHWRQTSSVEYFSEWSDKFGAQRCERASTICRDWSQVQRQVLIRCHPQHSRCCSWWPTKKGWHKLQLCSLFDSPSHTLHVLSLLCASSFWKDYFLIVVSVWFSMSRCPTVPRHLVLLSFFRRSHLFLHDSGLSWIALTPTFLTYTT